MKGFKKLALVAAIAAPLSSVHALEALDDSTLSGMTGQSGISIDLTTQVSIDRFDYTDEGTLSINGIEFGGAGADLASAGTAVLDDIKIDIDVEADGDLLIHLGTQDVASFLQGTKEIDFGFAMDSMTLTDGTDTTTVLGRTAMQGNLGPIDLRIDNQTSTISLGGYFQITDGEVAVPIAGMQISGLKIYQDANVGALGAAGGADGFVSFALAVNTASTNLVDQTGTATTVDNALAVTVASFNADIDATVGMGSVGGVSQTIGTIHMENLDVSGTTLKVYGH